MAFPNPPKLSVLLSGPVRRPGSAPSGRVVRREEVIPVGQGGAEVGKLGRGLLALRLEPVQQVRVRSLQPVADNGEALLFLAGLVCHRVGGRRGIVAATVILVVVFLTNVRAAVITLLALPLSLVAAVIAMDRFGLTINSMSLGGLAIAGVAQVASAPTVS